MLKKYLPGPEKNHLLAALSPDIQNRLFPHLELVDLPLYAVIYEANRSMAHVYFPVDSIISLQYLMEDGESTAISVVGNEGLLGINLVLGSETSPCRSLVQIAGYAYRLPKHLIEEEFNRQGQMMKLMLSYTYCLLTQVAQTAVCNRRHSIYEQLCRWLLISLDRIENNELTMTQEFIANMLGVRREGVTEAANKLRAEGLITYSRGKIHVIDRQELENVTCECYSMVKAETDRLLEYWPSRELIRNNAVIRIPSHGSQVIKPRMPSMLSMNIG